MGMIFKTVDNEHYVFPHGYFGKSYKYNTEDDYQEALVKFKRDQRILISICFVFGVLFVKFGFSWIDFAYVGLTYILYRNLFIVPILLRNTVEEYIEDTFVEKIKRNLPWNNVAI